MSQTQPGRWARIGAGLTRIRLFLSNLFFFGFLFIAAIMLLSGGPKIEVPDGGALVLDPAGRIVERRSIVDPLERWLSPGGASAETELESILKALERAQADDRIKVVVLDFDELEGVSTAHADAIGEALARFRAAGKEVIAFGSAFDQQTYLMASAADAVYMHPLGQLLLPGYRVEHLYYQQLLERLKVNVHVFRAGQYKEFVEPYTRSDMSPEARTVNAALIDGLWSHYASRIVERRRLDRDRFDRYSQFLDQALPEADGDMARLAVEYQLVDELLTPDQARVRIGDKVGYDDEGEFRAIAFGDYLRATGPEHPAGEDVGAVGVITAEGPIVMNGTFQGMIAADALVDLIRDARENDAIRALVLRIDSPGGSSFASELIRQELELLQLAGKPVVVSMGPVAASGGYWIASTADAIVAEPTTLTGSIGVFGILPSFEDSLASIGISADGVATASVGDINPLSGINTATSRVLQASTDNVYQRFVNLVARGRDLPPEQVEALAQGRVWLGMTAAEKGLVDALGDRRAAIARAAELAKLETYDVREIQPALTPGQLLLQELANSAWLPQSGWLQGTAWQAGLQGSALAPLVRRFESEWLLLETLTDPRHQYALCGQCAVGSGGPFGPW